MPSYYYTKFQKNPCVGRNERCPLVRISVSQWFTRYQTDIKCNINAYGICSKNNMPLPFGGAWGGGGGGGHNTVQLSTCSNTRVSQ